MLLHQWNNPVKEGYFSGDQKSWEKGSSGRYGCSYFRLAINLLLFRMKKHYSLRLNTQNKNRAAYILYHKALLLFLFFTIPAILFSQTNFADSIRKRIALEKKDTELVRLYVQLGNRLRLSDTMESWRCQKEIIKIADKKNNDYFRGQGYLLAGTIYLAARPAMAIGNYEMALKMFAKIPDKRKAALSMAPVYINLGVTHNSGNDYETAIYYYLKAEEIYLKYDPQNTDLALLYSNLSITYGSVNKYSDALASSKKGLDFARKGTDKVNLMNAYYAYGGNLANAKQSDNSIHYLDSAKKLAQELNNLYYIYSADFMKGLFYVKSRQFEKAKEYYKICLEFAREHQSPQDMGNNYLNIAAIELNEKNSRIAAKYLDSAGKYLDLTVASISKQEYFENYAELYNQLGNHVKAFALKDSSAALKDTIYQADNIKQTEFRQARYNYEQQQHEIEKLENDKLLQELTLRQRRNTLIILAVGIVALFITGLLAYRNYRQKQKLQRQRITELETEKQLTATEAVLKGEEQERTRLAKDLHDGLGGMLSGIKYALNTMKENLIMTPDNALAFERSIDMLDSSIKEMRRVAHNMMPETLVKFGLDTALKDYCNDINLSGALQVSYQSFGMNQAVIEQTTAIIVFRIVQELLNNTIKHAGATSAIVQLSKTEELLSVTVEDNGKGFDTAILKKSTGIGWDNIQNRVDFLKGKLDVSAKAGKGTSVLIELKA